MKRFIIGVVAIVLWVFLGLLGVPMLIEQAYMSYFGADNPYFITSNLSGVPILLCMGLFAVYTWLFFQNGILGNLWKGEEGAKAKCSKRTKFVIATATLFVVIVGSIGSTFWFERYTKEGVEIYHFGKRNVYTWEEVEAFTLKGDRDGVMVFQLNMKDGKKYSFNGGLLHAVEYCNDAYEEQFPEDVYDYTVWLSKEFGKRNIPMEIKDWEAMKDDLEYDSWKDLAESIREAYEEATGC